MNVTPARVTVTVSASAVTIALLCCLRASGSDPKTAARQSADFQSLKEMQDVDRKLRQLVRQVAPAVVYLQGPDEFSGCAGSGVIFDASGLILTHGHYNARDVPAAFKAVLADGRVLDATLETLHRSSARDYSILKMAKPGKYPFAPLRRGPPPAVGERCFHLGYPHMIPRKGIESAVLRLGHVSALGQFGIYASCLVANQDSGGPLFDLEGRIIGILNGSIGPATIEPGMWAGVNQMIDGKSLFQPVDPEETVRLGLLNTKRSGPGRNRNVAEEAVKSILKPAIEATVQVLVDDRPTILGTVVDAAGLILTKRSEIMTHGGKLVGGRSPADSPTTTLRRLGFSPAPMPTIWLFCKSIGVISARPAGAHNRYVRKEP